MSNPLKDHQIQKDEEMRNRVYEKYEPIVLWVKSDRVLNRGKGSISVSEEIRRWLRDVSDNHPFFNIANSNEPRIREIVTEFDDLLTSENVSDNLVYHDRKEQWYCPYHDGD